MNAEATMMPMTVRQVAEAVQGRLIVPQTGDGVEDGADALATSAVSDSRQVREGSVFVAIAGERVDGHDFVARAGESGAVVALVQHEVDAPVAQIVVPDTVDALGLLAKANIAARRAVGTPFTLIGITGSVGKTTTKDLMAALLSTLGPTVAPVGSFNNEIGLPLTALKVGRDTRFFVAEMGASHVGEITRLTTIAPPDIAVVLKVGCAHLGEFRQRRIREVGRTVRQRRADRRRRPPLVHLGTGRWRNRPCAIGDSRHAQRDERPRRGERRPPAGRAAAVDRRDAVASVPHQPAPHGGVHGPARRDVFHADR